MKEAKVTLRLKLIPSKNSTAGKDKNNPTYKR